ncbi:hypothetical protein [Caldalkalibacillus mannanilyticus]|uniref:hypothetical protein n=1 Tax=Caldalkalibacillus mannanilyticus TaxID=1418 RepID=UPI00046A3B8A
MLGIDVTTGKKLWEYTLPDDTDNVTTSPIVVTFGNDAEQTEVHFGTAKGKLVKLSNIEGGQAALKAEIQSIPDYPVREDITSYYQGVGLSSGIVAAGGLYLFGINTRQVPNEKGLGSLFAYNTTRADFYVESIEGRKSVSKGDQLNTRVKVGNRVKKDFPKVEVTLELHNNNGLVRKLGSKDVNFSTAYDQKNQATFSWEVNEEPGNYKLVAEINPAGPNRIVESDYTNNKAEASLEVGKEPQKRICTPNEKDAMSTITETWCNGVDEEGIPICRDQDIEITLDIDELLAYATKVKEDQSLEKLPEIGGNVEMKAGQGFVIEVDSALNYYPPPNDTQKYPGSFRVSLVVDNDPNIYELEPTNGDRSHINTWYLKEAWLPMFEGEMVYNVQPNGNYISGGRAYYTKLDQADGMIAYKIKIETVGPGLNLSECLDKEIKVKGSIFDDIYVRRINPAKPFNHLQNSSQIGPTWSGTTILDNYAKWWTGERDLPDNNYIYKRFKIKNGNEENLE